MFDLSEGLHHERRGDPTGAVRLYDRLLNQLEDAGERAVVLVRIGTCLLETDLDEAENRLGDARRAAEDAQSEQLLGEVELLEGRLAQHRGSHRAALAKLTAAADKLRDEDGRPRLDITLLLAATERARGELARALERLETVDEGVWRADPSVRAEYLDELGATQLARGDFRSAVETLAEALRLDVRLDSQEYKSGRSRLLLAEAHMGRGDRVRSKRLIQEAIEIFDNADTGLSEAYALLGRWYEDQADFQLAARSYRQAQTIDQESDDDLGEARAVRRLARVSRKRGDHDQASEYIDRARALLGRSDDDVEVAALLTEEGWLAIEQSEYDRAVAQFTEALRRTEEDGDERAVAVGKRNLAMALWERGDAARAEELLREARPVFDARGDLRKLDDLLDDLAEVLLEGDRYAEAIETAKESLALDEQLEATLSMARSQLLLGRCYLGIGDGGRAGDCLRSARAIYEEHGDEVGLSDALYHLGEYQSAQGRVREAAKCFRTALLLDSKHNDAVGIARAQRGLAGVYRRQGDFSRAQEHLDDATSGLLRIKDPAEKALLTLEAGRLAMDRGDRATAETLFRDAARAFDDLGSPVKSATCRRWTGIVLAANSKYRAALEQLRVAEDVFKKHLAAPELDQLYDDLALVYLASSRPAEAREAVERSLGVGQDIDWERGNARSHLVLAHIEMQDKNFEAAEGRANDAIRAYESTDDDVGLADALSVLGAVEVLRHEDDAAVRAYKRARYLQQSHRDHRGLARTFRSLGELYLRRKEYQRAEEAFEQADDYLRSVDDPAERGPLHLARGRLSQTIGDHVAAVQFFERALDALSAIDDTEKLPEAYRRLAASHQALEQYDKAMYYMREMGLEQASLWKSLLETLHPEIGAVAIGRYTAGEYRDAVVAAFRVLEEAIVQRTSEMVPSQGGKPISTGARLRKYISRDIRGLAPFIDENALVNFQNFCVGSFGFLRNSAVHGWRDFNGVDAFAALAVAHLIATLLDGTEPSTLGSTQGSDVVTQSQLSSDMAGLQ